MNKEGISHIPRFKPKIRTRIDESNHKSTKQTTNRHYRGLHRTRPKPQCPHGLACAATCPHGPPSNRASGNRTTEQRQHLKGTRRRPTFLDVTGEALTTSRPFHLHPQARRRATPQPHGPCANGEQRGWLLGGPPASATEAFASVCNQSRMGTEEQEKGMEEEESQR